MQLSTAKKEDLNRLIDWSKDVPEFQNNLSSYMERDDTAVIMMENEQEITGIALLKVKVTEKTGTVWLHLNDKGKQSHPELMQMSLKWLRQKGARDYTVI
ncbi:hypothetical protein KUV80_16675 [Fictibacillus nanhaiensis]|uniref:hypothetical protein n=1 Tax=Fictibacillus nanhaiensis TaxID=742169 RepID=UPI001C96D92B|nr:hypothetical protein [Fictibacillus nanhaiensis]MBY6038283.1 hypothetical protein [Fictibacillus nanhaiensis]